MTPVGLIGCGGIAQDVVAALRANPESGVSIVGALARRGGAAAARAKLPGIEVVETLDELLARGPKVIAEVASQTAVAEHGLYSLRELYSLSELGASSSRSGSTGRSGYIGSCSKSL